LTIHNREDEKFIMVRWLRWVLVLAAFGAAIIYGIRRGQTKDMGAKPELSTSALRIGGLVSTINATGTIEPEDLIRAKRLIMDRWLRKAWFWPTSTTTSIAPN
jgi:hypothetical protein